MGLSFCSPAVFILISRSFKSGEGGISVTLDVPKRRGSKYSKFFAAFPEQTSQMTSMSGLLAELPEGVNTGRYKCEPCSSSLWVQILALLFANSMVFAC